MVVIHKEIYQNLATISSPFCTGHAGFLGIMMLKALYVQCFNDPFQPPLHLGKYPDNIPTNASAQQCSKLLICLKALKLVYDTFKVVTQCSGTNSRRRSTRTTWLSLMILTLLSLMSIPASSTSTLLIDMQKLIYEWLKRIKNSSMPPWTPSNS